MATFFDTDPVLRRLERHALMFCGGAAVAAWLVWPDRLDVAFGVLGGGLLMGASYWTIRSSATVMVALVSGSADASTIKATHADDDEPAPPGRRRDGRRAGAVLVRVAARYALLGLVAYAMIARLRLHPVGLLIGMSSLVAAASLEAVRAAAGGRRP
jgi:hypothetical protein